MNVIKCNFPESQTKNWVPLKIDKIKFLIVHHIEADTATPEDINKWHLGFGWNGGFGYGEYIKKDGTVYIGRGDNIQAQCAGFNSVSYGIALEGNYEVNGNVPQAQYDALLERIRYHLGRFPKNCVVIPHRELVQTSCPGSAFPMTKLLSDINMGTDELKQALATLVRAGVMKAPEYWTKCSAEGSFCRGDYVQILLINFAKYVNSK